MSCTKWRGTGDILLPSLLFRSPRLASFYTVDLQGPLRENDYHSSEAMRSPNTPTHTHIHTYTAAPCPVIEFPLHVLLRNSPIKNDLVQIALRVKGKHSHVWNDVLKQKISIRTNVSVFNTK